MYGGGNMNGQILVAGYDPGRDDPGRERYDPGRESLGHRHIESTLLYRRYLLPEERVTISGASRLPFPDVPLAAAAPMSAQPCGP
jgi:hypothetical protein